MAVTGLAPQSGVKEFSVFPAPPLCTLAASDYQHALSLARQHTGRGLSKQAFALLPKIKDVREALQERWVSQDVVPLDPLARPRVAEIHPEVSFQCMAGSPMSYHKSRQAGISERLIWLERGFPNIAQEVIRAPITSGPAPDEGRRQPSSPGLDDVLDAVAAAWTARRLVSGKAKRLGGTAEDETGFPMNIWV
jgi:predicted RNase H-like nuclease